MTVGSARFDAASLARFAAAALVAAGMTEADARLTADTLVQTDLRGVMTHGLVRLPIYLNSLRSGSIDPTAQPVLVREDASTALMDGTNAMGQVVGVRAMEVAIRKARQTGTAAVAVRHSNHFGACAYYAMLAAQEGMIGIAMTNGSAAMAPWGGVDALVGTNPFALATPGPLDGQGGDADGPCPVVLDIAMTIGARGKIKLAELKGESLPPGWALDADGRPTQDPTAALAGSVAPMAGHKGYGLGVFVDLLTAALSGAALSPELENMGFTENRDPVVGPEPVGSGTGHWLLAVDVSRFLPLEDFRRRVRGYAAMLKGTRLAAGASGVYLPGELECISHRRSLADGIAYEPHVIADLQDIASEYGVPSPQPLA